MGVHGVCGKRCLTLCIYKVILHLQILVLHVVLFLSAFLCILNR